MRLELPNAKPDPRVRRFVMPTRCVWQSQGDSAPQNLDRILQGGGGAPCVLKHAEGQEPPGFLLDFGRELQGGIRIETGASPGHRPIRVRVRFGESVSEAMGKPNQDHAIHDLECILPWWGQNEVGTTGFRFARIDLVDPGAELHLHAVKAVFIYRDLDYVGTFHCNDDRLNQIWETGAYTVHLCMQDMLWDGIKRDRLVWIGDMHPETMVIARVFGAEEIVPQSLDFLRDQTPLPGWMNGISSYSLWWLLIQHAWYLYHGDRAYLDEQRPYLLDLLRHLQTQIGEDGREKLGGHRFLDWPSSGDQTAIQAGLQSLLTLAFTAGGELCHTLDECNMQMECAAAAKQLKGYTPAPTPSKQANALMALAGLADPQKTNQEVLAKDPLQNISTFYGYYVLQARAAAGDYAGCLEVIRKYWGAMLDLGATTFWEDFHLSWTENAAGITELVPEGKKDIHGDFGDYCYKGLRHSLCHGWAAGPVAWLSEHVLGLAPLEPGCAKLRVSPHLAGLDFAEGTFPTPRGIVKVRHEKTPAGAIKTSSEAPDGIELVKE